MMLSEFRWLTLVGLVVVPFVAGGVVALFAGVAWGVRAVAAMATGRAVAHVGGSRC